jgi:uncharacterized membrane protein
VRKVIRFGLAAAIVSWALLPPLLHAWGLHAIANALEWPWTMTCHRLPDRTMHLFGSLMPMCSRCAGLDVGFGLGLAIGAPWRGFKLMWSWIAVAALVLGVEMVTQKYGLHPIWHLTRFVTGALLAYPIGVALAAIVLPSRPDA